jgi:putative ABC transport system permease protein
MREEFAALGVSLRRRSWIGAGLSALGAAAAVAGAVSSSAGTGASLVGLGLLGVGAGALLLSPLLSRWIIGPLGRLVGRPFGAVGRLARTNAVRNPRRTAATAFALTLGLLLVAGIAVLGASTKRSINALVDNGVTADYILTTQNQLPLPIAASEAASKVAGVGSFVRIANFATEADGKAVSGSAVDGPLQDVLKIDLTAGSGSPTGTNLVISQSTATDKKWAIGRSLTLSQPGGVSVPVTVRGIYKDNQLLGAWLVSGDIFRQLTPKDRWNDSVNLVRAAAGTSQETLRTNLESATDPYYVVKVQNRREFKGTQAGQINGLLSLLYGLLGLAIVIAVLGIVNTLALSVVERRREIGMLRAIGLLRGQLRRAIYVESALIATFGAVLGVSLGLAFGALFTYTLRHQGLAHIEIPWAQAVGFLVLAAAVGVLAALWPAFRAARAKPLDAIAES